jgi:hypothetical protein
MLQAIDLHQRFSKLSVAGRVYEQNVLLSMIIF